MSSFTQLGPDFDGEAANDRSGSSISLSSNGSIIAIGTSKNDGNGEDSGHTRIYQWDAGSSSWNQLGSDIDGDVGHQSGDSVSLSSDGHTIAISEPGVNSRWGAGSKGRTRIFTWNGDAWVQRGSAIDGRNYGDYNGTVSLSSDGSVVAIGAYHHNGLNGHTRIFQWDAGSSSWNQLGEITGAHSDRSGRSVSLSSDGTVIAVGEHGSFQSGNGFSSGRTRLFAWNGSSWVQRGSDIDGEAASDVSGYSVSLSGDGTIVAVGAYGADGNGEQSGHTRLYQWDAGSSSWNQLGSDIDGEAAGDRSGYSVALSSDGTVVAIGALRNDGNGTHSGHTRIYQWSGSAWVQIGTDVDGEAEGDESGDFVSLSRDGSTVAIGARLNDGNGNEAGHVRVFSLDITPPTIAISSDVSSLKAGETATLTFTLSEASSNFVQSDVTVSGGTLSNWNAASATSYSATFTPTADSTSNGVISVASSKFSDSAGNTNSDGSDNNNSVTLSVDTVRPTIAISSDVSSLKAGETATLTFTLSEASSNFVQSDVTVSGGTLSNWNAASATSYSATFTPTADSTSNGVISVASSKFSDSAGNTNTDGSDSNNTVTLSVDTVRPTIAVSSDVSSLKAGETASLTFTLSEASSNFVQSDITVSGGTLSNWNAASATSYSATFTPTADSTSNGVISVASSKFSDSAGNTNSDGSDNNNSVTLSVDTVRPTIAISSDVSSLKAGETATLTFTLSEASSNFVQSDVTVSGGTLSNWNAASATSYSATFTPTADSTSNGVISVASSKFSDSAGNTNSDGSDNNNSVTLSVDTVRPTIAISSDVSSLKAGETATLTFTLSEASSNFVQSDVTVSGGTLSNWNAASATSYSATFTPTADSTSNGVISVASSKFSDSAGNTNSDGSDNNNSVTLSVDTVRPTFQSAASNTGGTKIILTYSETLSSTTAAISTFSVTTASKDKPITDVAIAGSTVELTLTNTIGKGQTVTVAYTDPSSSDDANAIQDSTGNDAASLSSNSVTNNSTVASDSSDKDSSDSGSNPSDTNALVLNSDNSFNVTDGDTKGLWLKFNVKAASTKRQNCLKIIDQHGSVLGAIGATQNSKNLGSHAIFIPEGSTIAFHQFSNNQAINSSPQLNIIEQADGSFQLKLNDGADDSDHDDLTIDITTATSSPNASATSIATEQTGIHDSILDLSSIPAAGQTLQLTINSDCSFKNSIAMVKLTEETDGSFSVNGKTNANATAFDQAVKDHLINPNGTSITATGVQTQTIDWTLASADAGFYSPVLINPNGELYTYGSSYVKILGCNFFSFEDTHQNNSSDFDYNDVSILFQVI